MHLDDAPKFLTFEEVAYAFSRVEYRPDWKLSVFQDPYEGPTLYVQAEVIDGYDSDNTVPLRIRSSIPHHRNAEEFFNWLQWRLMQIEIHECREYFHVDGKPWSDPHDVIEPKPIVEFVIVNPPEPGMNDNSVSVPSEEVHQELRME